jgi:hypothetical protein
VPSAGTPCGPGPAKNSDDEGAESSSVRWRSDIHAESNPEDFGGNDLIKVQGVLA